MVVDPRGRVLAAAGHEDAVLMATLDLSEIPAERRREPSLGMGRPTSTSSGAAERRVTSREPRDVGNELQGLPCTA